MYDLIIVGAGPGGMTAAIYAARRKLNFAIISMDVGGQMAWSSEVENYPGFEHISGVELTKEFMDHLKDYNIKVISEEVVKVGKHEDGRCFIDTNKNYYDSKAILIATGKSPRKLGISGEEFFLGKGVHYCATCDAPLYNGKNTVVVGGGNSGMEAALYLSNYCKKVYVAEVGEELRGEEHLKGRVSKTKNIEVMTNVKIKDILGDDKGVRGVLYEKGNKEIKLADCGNEHVFVVCDGRILRNLHDLLIGLREMSDESYGVHSNFEKSDFSNWVKEVFKDSKLALDLKKSRTREQAIYAVGKKLGKLGNALEVSGVFIEVGLVSKADFVSCDKNEWGEIMISRSTKTHEENLTSIPGIFACGDVSDIPAKQIVVAAGEGAKAAMASFDYISRWDSEHEEK